MKITFKITLCGILSSMALIAFILEGLFPPIIIPGARLGLSNIFILLAAIILGAKYGFASLLIKTVIGSIFSGNVSSIMYSLPAGIVALTAELLLLCFMKVSVVSVSVCGSFINTTIQNLTFCLVTNTYEYISYLPYLSLIGVVSGIFVGFTVYLIIKKLPINKYFNNLQGEK